MNLGVFQAAYAWTRNAARRVRSEESTISSDASSNTDMSRTLRCRRADAHAPASSTTTYTYDANGNRLTATEGTMTISATYDRLNRVTTVDDEDAGTGADTSYAYDLTSPAWTDPTGSYGVTLDAFDRPTALDDPVTATDFTFAYRADGQPDTTGQPNGNTTAFGYDALGRPSAMTTTGTGGASRAAYAWTRNAAGAVRSEQTTITGDPGNGTRTFAYDPLGRLVTWSDDGGTTTTAYGWDKVLNRTSVDPPAGAAVATGFDAANRPTDQAGVADAYASDADGRLTARPDAAGGARPRPRFGLPCRRPPPPGPRPQQSHRRRRRHWRLGAGLGGRGRGGREGLGGDDRSWRLGRRGRHLGQEVGR